MPFSSLHFLFLFLPVALLLYFIVPLRWWRNGLLLIASLIFYAWGEPVAILLLVAYALMTWMAGRLIERANERGKPGRAKGWTVATVALSLCGLAVFKYSGFLAAPFGGLGLRAGGELLLPVGISFYTFSAISYIIDVYRQAAPAQRNLILAANYIAMFPKLLQGPIARYEEMQAQLLDPRPNLVDAANGARRFIVGLAKKVLLADMLAVVANQVFGVSPSALGLFTAWYGLLAFALQIYFDFSSYTDMAIGLGMILGFRLPENFNFPYISRSITDFWRRWHMTLTAWFRSYLFLPLEFARKREKHLRQQSNLLIVFLLTGLWHGASWNFVLWGGYFGVILAIEASGWGKRLKKAPVFWQHLYALALILFGWVFFRIENVANWGPFFGALFGAHGLTGIETARTLNILLYWPLMVVAILLSMPFFGKKIVWLQPLRRAYMLNDIVLVGLFFLSVVFLVSGGYHAFLYFQF